ncbi:ATP:cob(I)alamin adenosyltransferase [Fontimonas thermophila]|uniref:Corrinoid adenosyltransferase n=1 Tax=Fontimonas thermophila TaxID=1076937 RepID=A0A1I2JA77_9GAMM|nr:cob(I)yrinic acid a,c-diamide adenosyltransferase [Fontimonas thermophila]SFF51424.1 ATP:cob(I)alamin adenosyltransferase [Fontimonas thermophila]
MGHRLSKIATRTGDTGTSGLATGERLPKTDLRFAAMGDLDELNSAIGVVLATHPPPRFAEPLAEVQHRLFDIGGELALPQHPVLGEAQVLQLDQWLADFNADLPPLKEFVLPGGGGGAAHAHFARAVARRAERSLWRVNEIAPVNPQSLRYLNRLSDLLFVIARQLARLHGQEVTWRR